VQHTHFISTFVVVDIFSFYFCLGRFQLPFAPPVHTPVSVHQVPGLQEKDTLTSEPAVSRLRLAWNLGWHENIENLSKVKGVEDITQSDKDTG